MRYYNKITIWENLKRIERLSEFKDNVASYFNSVERTHMGFRFEDGPESHIFREKINLSFTEIRSIIHMAGLSTYVHYSPPPAVGGMAGNVDMLANIFGIDRFQISPRMIIDIIDKAIGVYRSDQFSARFRTFNPFFWIWSLFKILGAIPFRILSILGFNSIKAEQSSVGQFIKGSITLLATLLAILVSLKELNWLDPLLEYFRNIFR